MNIKIRNGYEEPILNWLPDIRIIIDVFRASTTCLAILEKRPLQYLVTNDFDVIQDLLKKSYRLVSEVYDLGIDNSPTLVKKQMVFGEKVVHKTTNLTTALEKNYLDAHTIIACFNNICTISKYVSDKKFLNIEIIPAGQMIDKKATPEDSLCAEMLMAMLKMETPNILPESLLGDWEEKKRTRNWPQHFIDDIELAVQMNISNKVPLVRKIEQRIYQITENLLIARS